MIKILFIHNNYRISAGEDLSVKNLIALNKSIGNEVKSYIRDSNEEKTGFFSKIYLFKSAISNQKSLKEISDLLDSFAPQVVQIQNIYPLISLDAIELIKSKGIPIVMRCPNYRLFCPNGLFFDSSGNICENCASKKNELWCVLKNCENDFFKSTAYAFRNFYARKKNIFKLIDRFIVQSDFQKNKFIEYGIDAKKIAIVPGLTLNEINHSHLDINGEYVSFIGRLHPSKGIDIFLEAARALPDVPFAIAGKSDSYETKGLPDNVTYKGYLQGNELNDFYANSKFIVVPSMWYEGFPNVVVNGMFFGKPIIGSNIGAMKSIIDDNLNGFLFDKDDLNDLINKIQKLFKDDNLIKKLGDNAQIKAKSEFSKQTISSKLAEIYRSVI